MATTNAGHRGSGSGKRRKKRSVATTIALVLRNIILSIFLTVLFVGVIGAGVIAGALFGYMETVEPIDVSNMMLNMTSFVYATNPDGEIVEVQQLYDDQNRVWVDTNNIPDNLKNAFIAIEDERYLTHHGFDVKRTVGATVSYVYNKLTGSGDRTYGGSTITQQLIKNLTGEGDYGVERKIREIYRAYRLEDELSKDEILEYYLNTIFLSEQCYGVSSAAATYFGKPVSALTLAECASIAGITQSPTAHNPYINPNDHKRRQETVLKKMLELEMITRSQYDAAVAEELDFQPRRSEQEITYQSYYVDAAIEQVQNDLMEKYGYTKERASRVLFNSGLKIYLAQDMVIQEKMDSVYSNDKSFPKGSGEIQPESAMVIMDPYTGQVKALVGGRGDKEGNRMLNRATQSTRQPGSTMKPIAVYGPAVEYGLITDSTIVKDAPVKYDGWSPKNVDGRFRGNITVRRALANSVNIPAVKVCKYLGVNNVFKYVTERMHLSTLVDFRQTGDRTFTDKALAPLALGGLTDGVTVLELTAAYCTFVNDGFYNKPMLYTQVLDANGQVILDGSPTHEIAMSERTAYEMISMMKDVVSYGSGTMANFRGQEIAGKTGTTGTSTSNDRWFVGMTPYYVGAVWFGYDKPKDLSRFSSNPAANAWRQVMSKVHEDLEYRKFEAPGKEVSVMICRESGQRANPNCSHVTSEMYASNSIPRTHCEMHPLEADRKTILSDGTATSSGSSNSSSSSKPKSESSSNSSSSSSSTESSGGSGSGSGGSESSGSGSESSGSESSGGQESSAAEGSSNILGGGYEGSGSSGGSSGGGYEGSGSSGGSSGGGESSGSSGGSSGGGGESSGSSGGGSGGGESSGSSGGGGGSTSSAGSSASSSSSGGGESSGSSVQTSEGGL